MANVIRSYDPAEDPTSFGELAVQAGYLSREQLAQTLTELKRMNGHASAIGEYLVDRGYLTNRQVELILLKQVHLRRGVPRQQSLMRLMDFAQNVSESVHSELDDLLLTLKSVGQEHK